MSTLATLKAEIADDLARSDLATQVASAINAAIAFYKTERFYFNETRSATFVTVANQSRYSSADDADIPLLFDVDGVFFNEGTVEYQLKQADHRDMERWLSETSPTTGQSGYYTYFDRTFWLYPVPDAVFTVRPIGGIEKAAPATDGEASNVWMTEAYELLRCRAKAYLFAHVIKNVAEAGLMQQAELQALESLRSRTSKRKATGWVRPTAF